MNKENIPPITSKIYIILSCYNEEKTLEKVTSELVERGFYVLIIDDGSMDNSPVIARKLVRKYRGKVWHYRHAINIGLGGAIQTGIKAALSKDADIIITFDADGQHNPDDLYNMYPPLQNHEADVVIGARDFEDMPSGRKFGNTVMNHITFLFQGKMVTDSQSGLRAFTADAARKLQLKSPQYGVSSEIIGEIKRRNLKLLEVPMTTIYDKRTIEKGTNTLVGIKILLEFLNETIK
ncbi:glycosyltransferase family 2 protein [Candidatus Methanosphaera massiliense]|jgi:glycosyltransferase involved in cell wall biosynthesis|uniref:glycosyltransferase family 2 protein n=1 Tax=Methanosphaera TaxID=2316 RepID=UPI0023802A6A|nr:glycosyltransferase family 2 protein [Candidatus Methanosphaera massiliense]MDE4078810.1 glycosyltransferase family 2 protein [Candidatus Methanosphaera massiliense]MDY2744686.1 glycosyltransferase family 2 protein [Methanosphaera sp.]